MQRSIGLLSISACLGIFVCLISTNFPGRFEHRDDVIRNQFAILHGEPHHFDGQTRDMPQLQSRVLFPVLLAGAAQVMPVGKAYPLLRLLTAIAAFAVFMLTVMAEGVDLKTATIGAGLLAYGLTFTFRYPWEHPTDFFDVLFFSLFALLTLRRRRLVLLLVTLAATLNHQTAAFAGVLWFFVWGFDHLRPRWGEITYSAVISVISYAMSTAIKSYLGKPSLGYVINGWRTVPQFIEALRHPQLFAWPVLLVAMLLPVVAWLRSNRDAVAGNLRRLLWASVAVVILSSPIAYWAELRSVFLAPFVLLAFIATIAEGKLKTPDLPV